MPPARGGLANFTGLQRNLPNCRQGWSFGCSSEPCTPRDAVGWVVPRCDNVASPAAVFLGQPPKLSHKPVLEGNPRSAFCGRAVLVGSLVSAGAQRELGWEDRTTHIPVEWPGRSPQTPRAVLGTPAGQGLVLVLKSHPKARRGSACFPII